MICLKRSVVSGCVVQKVVREILEQVDTKFERMEILHKNNFSITWFIFEQEVKRQILNLLRSAEGEDRGKVCYAYLYMLNRKELLQSKHLLGVARRWKRKEGKILKQFALGEKKPKKKLDVEHLINRSLGLDNYKVKKNGKSARSIW